MLFQVCCIQPGGEGLGRLIFMVIFFSFLGMFSFVVDVDNVVVKWGAHICSFALGAVGVLFM